MPEDRQLRRAYILFLSTLLFLLEASAHRERPPPREERNHFRRQAHSSSPVGWSDWSQCSRTCGTGISTRSRLCRPNYNAPAPYYQCSRDSKQFKVCNTEVCPTDNEPDYRHFQCSLYNNREIAGEITTKWVPVKGHVDCELKCKSVNHRRIYTFGKAADGTKCHLEKDHVCVNGRCLPFGCDLLVGSRRILDSCGVCGGRNDSCSFISNEFRGQRRRNANEYQEVAFIPAGSSRIKVEDRSGNNHLALMDSRRRYVINGDRTLGWPGRYEVAGAVVNYSRHGNQESFTIDGPTNEDIYIMVLMYERNPGIRYKYWAPKDPRTRRRNRPPKNDDENRIPEERPRVYPTDGTTQDPNDNIVPSEIFPPRNPKQSKSGQRNRHNGTYWSYDTLGNNVTDDRVRLDVRNSTQTPVYPADQVPEAKRHRKRKNKGGGVNDTRYHRGNHTRNRNASCSPCQRVNSRLQHFCDSDFVMRAQVLDAYPVGQEMRYALEIIESYKNNLGIVSREYLWTNDVCRCPKLRRGTEYILMGKSDPNFRRNEVRLLLERTSYVRKFNPKREYEMKKLRQLRHDRCRRKT